ncbi:MAG: tetratricopeptide repeat protein [Gemmatimonadaceae bacterium]|nr:tetratricopeptide repeat protein [Gemmatimonadaceae bacterium]
MSQLDETVISARLGEFIADARFAEALDLLDQCLMVGPGDAWLYGMRALLLLETGDTTGALSASATAVQQAPIAAFAHWTRGVVLLRAGIMPGAQRAAERAVSLDPEESDTHVLLARVYLQKAAWEQARAAIDDAALHGADDEELMPLRAAIAAGRGLDVRAGDTWRAFAHRFPANALARTGHAWTLLEGGDVQGARAEFEQARELDPTNTWALEGLVITNTRLLPVHRRWFAVLHGRVMQRREETMVIAGAFLTSAGLVLLAMGQAGIVLPLALTLAGAGLPVLDAWRRGEVATR